MRWVSIEAWLLDVIIDDELLVPVGASTCRHAGIDLSSRPLVLFLVGGRLCILRSRQLATAARAKSKKAALP